MTEPVCEFPAHNSTNEEIKEILSNYKVVAVVGISNKPDRDSFRVASFLKERGYKIVPVNPNYDAVLGEKCYPNLSSIPFAVEIVDIFRKPEAVPPIADEAIKVGAKAVWMQIGIVNNEAAERLIKNGIKVVMNKCMMIEYNNFSPDFPDTTGQFCEAYED
jgi:predicted CoA-binding protein